MRAGKLDRRVTIQSYTQTGTDIYNVPTFAWADVATVWAQQRPNRGAERFTAAEVAGSSVLTFHIRHRGVTVQDRLLYGGKTWDIVDVREIGRGVVTEIDATARAE
ncbi:Bacteriophage head-tail adaptor [Stappia sp. 22II-S9-Z10]|nr:Bacteriophage head-tail adaptor [Stappia sp. 22II-S9-Z10]